MLYPRRSRSFISAVLAAVAPIVTALPSPAGADAFSGWVRKASKALKQNEDFVALDYYARALESWRSSDGRAGKLRVLLKRAELQDRHGESAEALETLKVAAIVSPKSSAVYRLRGEMFFKLGKRSEAMSDFYKAASLNLLDPKTYYERAMLYEAQGDLAFAAEDYKTACRLKLKKACPEAKRLKPALKAKSKPASAPALPSDSGSAPR